MATLRTLSVMLTLLVLFDLMVVIEGQTGSILKYTIFEGEADNKRVGNIKQDSDIASRRTPDELAQLEFIFRYTTGMYKLFTINKRTGVVRTNGSIDREAICAYKEVCDIDLDIKVNPVTYFEIIKIKVNIEDKNDNPPQFTPKQKSTSVAETTNPGALIPIPSADDKDSGNYGIQGYRLDKDQPGSEKFDLQVTEHSDGSMDINIVLLEKLDRETEAFYTLVVYAFDGDVPQQSGSITVDLTVTDVNDNTPKFDNATYETTIFENLPLRSTILQVHASDPDSGDFGKVVYSFASSIPDEYHRLFGINKETGEIYVKGLIDYEVNQLYQFNVQAKDKGLNSLPTFTKVRIRVLDLNDHAPLINVNALTDSGDAEVLENADVGTFVAHIAVMDPDLGQSGLFECDIDNTAFQLVALSGSTMEYTLVSRMVFDREKIAQYHVLLTCADKGSPVLSAVEQIEVNVMDENDHLPEFGKGYFFARLRENNTLNAVVMTIEAEDADTGRNAAIRYSLQAVDPSEDGLLLIDVMSGVIKANTVFDYEKKQSFEFVVTATDHGEPPESTSADLRLTVQDVNDEYPVFDEQVYLFTVQEGLAKDTPVGNVTATDKDSPQYGNITYLIDASSRGSHCFYIDKATGQIFTAKVLDWETQEVYHLGIFAQNVGSPSIQTRADCTVHVQDMNDNPPIIDFPSKRNNTLEISNQTPVDYLITRILAHDLDSKKNGNGDIRYYISEESNVHFFKVDSQTGALSVARDMESIGHQQVLVSVTVTDQGKPPLASHEQLNIIIDKSLASPLTQNTSFLEGNLMAILGSLVGLIFIIVVVTIAICLLKYRRRGRDADKGAKYNCRLEANKALNGGGGKISGVDGSGHSYDEDTASMKSDCSIDSPIKEIINKPLKKEVTFTFSQDEPYTQRSPAGRAITQETSLSQETPKFLSPAKRPSRPVEFNPSGGSGLSDRSARNYPHITDPRKYGHHPLGLRHYDRSPTHLGQTPSPLLQAGSGGSGVSSGRKQRAGGHNHNDHLTQRSLEMHDMLNLSNHTDMDSECSGTDSGRGPSEEGDNTNNLYAHHHNNPHHHPHHHHPSHHHHPLPPAPPQATTSQYSGPTPVSSVYNTNTTATAASASQYSNNNTQSQYRIDPYYSSAGESRNVNPTSALDPTYSTARGSPQRHSLRERPQGCSPIRHSPERASMRELPTHSVQSIPERPHRLTTADHNGVCLSHLGSSPDEIPASSRYHGSQKQPQALDARELIPLQKLKLTDVLLQAAPPGGHEGQTDAPNGDLKKPDPFSTFRTKNTSEEMGSNAMPTNNHQSHTGCVHHPHHLQTDSDHNGNYGNSQQPGTQQQHNSSRQYPYHNQQHQAGSQNSSFDHSIVSNTSDYSSRPSSTTSNRELSIYQGLPDPSSTVTSSTTTNNHLGGGSSPHKQLPSLLKTPAVTLEHRDQTNLAGNNKKEVRFAEDYKNRSRSQQDVCSSSLEGGVLDLETCTSGSYVLDPSGGSGGMLTMGRLNSGAHYEDIPSYSVV